MATQITGGGVEDMRALAVKLRAADPQLRNGLRREFKRIAAPVVADVQRTILDMPSADQTHALREEVARTVTATTSVTATGIRLDIVSLGRRMPTGEDTLPKHLDSSRGWGHPVFARGPRSRWRWVHQFGRPQWFEAPIARAGNNLRAGAQRAMDEVRQMLEG